MNAAAPQSAASAASPLFPQRCSPSWDQQEAIATLSNQDIDDVFAYIRYAKSFEGVFARKDGFHSVGGGLSVEQVHAIETLSGCADRKLRTWLRTARDSGTSAHSHLSRVVVLIMLSRWTGALQKLPEQLPLCL